MLSVYVGKLLPRFQHLEMLFPNLGIPAAKNDFGEINPFTNASPFVKTVDYPSEADAFLFPYPYNVGRREQLYLTAFIELAKENRKPLIVAAFGDQFEMVDDRADIVLRTSAYKKSLTKRDMFVPPTVSDVGAIYGVLPKQKEELPTVGFCGYAGFPNIKSRLTFTYKNLILGTGGLFNERLSVMRQGIYFRRKAMNVLSHSSRVQTKFITRSFYSGSRKTIGMDAGVARREYIENMQNADLVLAPKGDGNYSLRFYEALSLGRIPLLIDTDTPLPGEESWYKDAILRVSWKDIGKLPQIVSEWFNSISNDEFIAMQERARTLFIEHLFAPRFYTELFADIERRIKTS